MRGQFISTKLESEGVMSINWKVSKDNIYCFFGDMMNKHVYVGITSRGYGGYYLGVSSFVGVENLWREGKSFEDGDIFKVMEKAEEFLKECLAKHMETDQ
jgi:hypothetical protein